MDVQDQLVARAQPILGGEHGQLARVVGGLLGERRDPTRARGCAQRSAPHFEGTVGYRIEGHEVVIASDVATAIEKASDSSFDLLLSDLTLPDGTGYDLMQRLCQKSPLHGIAITGHDGPEVQERCLAAGFTECLIKPVSMERLNTAISRVLEQAPCQG